MTTIIEQTNLYEALKAAKPALAGKSSHLSIITGFHFQVDSESNTVTITASDLEKSIKVETGAQSCKQDIDTVLPGKYFYGLAQKAPSKPLVLQPSEDGGEHDIQLTWDGGNFDVQGLSGDEYPDEPVVNEPLCEIAPGVLASLLKSTIPFCSDDETRMILTGVDLTFEGKDVRATSTDGYRIATRTGSVRRMRREAASVTIPVNSAEVLAKQLRDTQERAEVYVESNQLRVSVGNWHFTSRLLNGEYPDVMDLVPDEFGLQIRVDKEAFVDSLQRVRLVAKQIEGGPTVMLDIDGDTLTLNAEASGVGKGEEEVAVEADGQLQLAFSGDYLLEALKSFPDGGIVMQFAGDLKPALLRNEELETYEHTVLPMRSVSSVDDDAAEVA